MDDLSYLTKRYMELNLWHAHCVAKNKKWERKVVEWFMRYYFDLMLEAAKKNKK